MENLKLITCSQTRAGQELQTIGQKDLEDWASRHRLSLRQAMAAALQAGIFPACYERNFPSLSVLEQLRLFSSRVLIAGLGGLGGTLATLLGRVGVGRFLLADGDSFSPSNLNRQWLSTQATLGMNKAEAAARHLLEINPAIEATVLPIHLTRENLPLYLPQLQLVLDGLDSLASRQDLFAAARAARIPLVHGAVVGRSGQVATILPDDPDPFTKIYSGKDPETAGGREILAPTAALTASLQAQEAVRLLTGQPPAYQGRLAFYDGDTGTLELLPLW